MNKTLLVTLIAIIALGVIGLIVWLVIPSQKSSVSTSSGPTVGLPVAGTAAQSNSNLIQGSTGTGVQTNNVINDPATVKDPINPGYYYLGYHPQEGVQDSTASVAPPYIIEYISATQYFNIALLQEPIGTTRVDAEQYLMAHLGISQAQMCQLNYMVSVPNSVNSQFSGRSLGFSFCPGAVALPQ